MITLLVEVFLTLCVHYWCVLLNHVNAGGLWKTLKLAVHWERENLEMYI